MGLVFFVVRNSNNYNNNCLSDTKEDRIVGGYTAAENKPWVVKVWLQKENSICGGTLINKRQGPTRKRGFFIA
jgi:hypothetical protein